MIERHCAPHIYTNSNNVLYLFFQCNLCGSMFHAECVARLQTCPKCEQIPSCADDPIIQ